MTTKATTISRSEMFGGAAMAGWCGVHVDLTMHAVPISESVTEAQLNRVGMTGGVARTWIEGGRTARAPKHASCLGAGKVTWGATGLRCSKWQR